MKRVFCSGSSMEPLIRPGDDAVLTPPEGGVSRGDVVVFRAPSGGDLVVHRVVETGARGIATRGDRCATPDPWLLEPACILGRVTAVERLGGRRPILGGGPGRLQASASRILDRFRRALLAPFGPLSRSAVARRLVRALWRPEIERIVLQPPGGTEIRYVHRGRTVARWMAGPGLFLCRTAYRFVLDRPGGERG
jgi:signal peptidase I